MMNDIFRRSLHAIIIMGIENGVLLAQLVMAKTCLTEFLFCPRFLL